MRIAFLGLGTMGAPMATNLVRAGHDLVVWNRTASRTAPLCALGARNAASPREAVLDRELVITMLADEHALHAVLHGEDGALAGLSRGAIVVDMSTAGREAVLTADADVRAQGGRFLDAPVSGTRGPAIAGKLLVLVGGDAATLEIARPALAAFGEVRHVGKVGDGGATKLVLNGLGAQMLAALASVLGLAGRLGLPRTQTLDLILAGPFSSPTYLAKRPRLLSADPGADPDFTITLWEKDQRLVLEEAARQSYAMPQLEAVRALLQVAIEHGRGDEDMAAIMVELEPRGRAGVIS